ncbi:MAG: sulfite exporter TauE/SafE family protein [Nitrosarchaeum sp.]
MFEELFGQIGDFAPAIIAGFGLALGIQHAFEADHISAVSTQITNSNIIQSKKQLVKSSLTKSTLLGALWGAGHTTTLILVGLLVYGFTLTIHKEVFSGFEFLVGLMLILLAFTKITNKSILKHRHPHIHKDGSIHFDEHNHHDNNHSHNHKSYLIGMIHGLAGSGTLIVMTSGMTHSLSTTLTFIGIFGIGSIIGMSLIGGLIGIPFGLTNNVRVKRIMRYLTGTLSFVLGMIIVYQIGILENLFRF